MKLLIGPRVFFITGTTIAEAMALYSHRLLLVHDSYARIVEIPTVAEDGSIVVRRLGVGSDFPWVALPFPHGEAEFDDADVTESINRRIQDVDPAPLRQLTSEAKGVATRYLQLNSPSRRRRG